MLFIEYDVTPNGEIELVALINAVEEEGQDPDGSAWMSWRSTRIRRPRHGLCRGPPDDLALMEATEDATSLRAIVERIILADRAGKEEVPS